jgi:hypothetical protein
MKMLQSKGDDGVWLCGVAGRRLVINPAERDALRLAVGPVLVVPPATLRIFPVLDGKDTADAADLAALADAVTGMAAAIAALGAAGGVDAAVLAAVADRAATQTLSDLGEVLTGRGEEG